MGEGPSRERRPRWRSSSSVRPAVLLRVLALPLLCTPARTSAAFLPTPSSIFPPPPVEQHGLFSAAYPSLYRRSVQLSATAKSFLGQAVTAVPNFIAQKALGKMDDVYVKRSLFLPPVKGEPSDTDAVVVLFPGIALTPDQYSEVAKAIQLEALASYNQSLYIVVAKFFNNLGYLPQEPERRLTSILAELEKQGVAKAAPVGVIGHSGGAFLAYDAALTKSQAFVHLGSTLNSKGLLPWKPRSLLQYPKPLLTVLAEMDGYIRVTAGALEWDVVEKQRVKRGFESLDVEKPVVVLPGVSHEQFADGTQSKMARMSGRRDLAPYVSIRDAWQSTARIVAAFLAVHLSPDPSPPQAALDLIKAGHRTTGRLMGPFLEQLQHEAEEDFVRNVQSEVAGVDGVLASPATIAASIYTSKPEFIYSKPTIVDKIIQVQVFRDTEDPIKTGFTKQVSPGLWLKMKRQEAVSQAFGARASKPAATAQDLNTRTFEWALQRVSPEARQRYEKYGRKLVFLPDDEITYERGGGPGWVAAPLQVLVDSEGGDFTKATLRSPVLYTPVDTLPRFAGMCYMKVLSRAQAMEWILHDAFIPLP